MWFIARFGQIFIGMIATFSMEDLSSIEFFLPNFNLKDMISTYLKDFSIKNSPNSPDFKRK
jgi:hypothetical protein